MATFLRQLNNYGFKKSAKDSSKLEFENVFFRKSEPQNYYKIKNRRKRNRTSEVPIANEASTALLSLAALPRERTHILPREKKVACSTANTLGHDGQQLVTSSGSTKSLPKSGAIKSCRDEEQSDPYRGEKEGESNCNSHDTAGGAQIPVAFNLPHHDIQDLLRHATVTEADDIATDSFDLLEGLNFSQNSKALRTYINHKLLDFSKPCCDQVMNTIARLTREIAQTKIGLVNFLDDTKQVMLGNFGLEYMTSCDFETAICRLTIRDDTSGVYIVPDCTKHDLLKDNILVTDFPHVRFYAGAPILFQDKRTRRVVKLGAVCVLDDRPRYNLDGRIKNCLVWLASLVSEMVQNRLSVVVASKVEENRMLHLVKCRDSFRFTK